MSSTAGRIAVFAVTLLLPVSVAWAQPKKAAPAKGKQTVAKPTKPIRAGKKGVVDRNKVSPDKAPAAATGPYQGVTLNRGGEPPEPEKRPPSGLQYVTWPGFQVTERGTEIFLQLTGPVIFQQKKRGHKKLWITMDNTTVHLKNSLRPVITQHFKTPVKRFRLRKLKGDKLRLEITLRRKATASVITRSAGQYTFLVVYFMPKKKRR